MPPSEDPHTKIIRHRYLYAAYGAAGIGFIFAVSRGWFTPSSSCTTEVAPAVILALAFPTVLARDPFSALQTPARPARSVIAYLGKALLCWVGAFAWMFLMVRRVPDTYVGAAVLLVPTLGLGLWGVTCFYRGSRIVTGAALRTTLTPHLRRKALPIAAPPTLSPQSAKTIVSRAPLTIVPCS